MTPEGESSFINQAEAQVKSLIKAARWSKLQIKILGLVCAALIVVSAVLTFNVVDEHNLNNKLRQQTVAACEDGNSHRHASIEAWTKFINIIVKDNPGPQTKMQATNFLNYIDSINSPVDCTKIFNVSGFTSSPVGG